MALGTPTVFASGNKAGIKNVNKKDGKPLADALRECLASRGHGAPSSVTQQQPPQPAAAASSDEVFAKLRQLGELRDAGIVTAGEFETKKAELLSRL
jgi:putative oligomerization/nucleic acid binding protein